MSEHESPTIETDATIALFSKLLHDSMTGLYAQVVDRFEKLEKAVEDLEKQMATMVLGYGEQAVFMEALVAQIAFAGDEARKRFHEDINSARRSMLEVMRDASSGLLANDSENLASALGDLVDQELSDPAQ